MEQADRKMMKNKKEGDGYFKIGNIVKNQKDLKAATMQGFGTDQFTSNNGDSQRDIFSRDQT